MMMRSCKVNGAPLTGRVALRVMSIGGSRTLLGLRHKRLGGYD